MKDLFEEYGSLMIASICGISVLSIFINTIFGSDNSLKIILENWLNQLI